MVRIRQKLNLFPDETPESFERTCARPGCEAEGAHRAAVSPERMNDIQWLCIEHIREHNASWNYYEDMTEEEVEYDVRRDSVWRRPTWRLGENSTARPGAQTRFKDAFGFFKRQTSSDYEDSIPWKTTGPERKALGILGLVPPLTAVDVKARYKELAKRHHPDANNGCKEAEEKFKRTTEAYNTIIENIDSFS